MPFFTKDLNLKNELQRLLILAIPLFGTQIGIVLMTATDNIMSGRVNGENLASLGLATGIAFPFTILVMGVLNGLSVLNSHAYGEKDDSKIVNLTQQGFYLAVFLSFFLWFFFFFNHLFLNPFLANLEVVQKNQNVLKITNQFLHFYSFGAPGLVFFCLLRSYLEPQNRTLPITLVALLSVPINVLLDYAFIFGKFGFPALGAAGTAIATSTVYWLMTSVLFIYVYGRKKANLFKKFYSINFSTIREIWAIGFSIAANILFEVTIFAVLPFFASPFGENSVAATQIAINFSGLVYQVPLSLSFAYTIRVSNLLGHREKNRAVHLSYFFIFISIAVGIAIFILFSSFSSYITAVYTNDANIARIASAIFLFVAVYQIPDALLGGMNGILRAFKDTRFAMWAIGVSYWLVAAPIGFFLSRTSLFGDEEKIASYFVGFIISMTLCSLTLVLRFRKIHRRYIEL